LNGASHLRRIATASIKKVQKARPVTAVIDVTATWVDELIWNNKRISVLEVS
jgi:hypothetical protein